MTKLHAHQQVKKLEKETKNILSISFFNVNMLPFVQFLPCYSISIWNQGTFTEKKNSFTQILAFTALINKYKQP